MRFKTLREWLVYIEALRSTKIELGLQRVREVAERLDLLNPSCPVITIGGTNGKGSTVAGLEAIYLKSGYRVGAFTSPYLFRHNEGVRIQGEEAEDNIFCAAFEVIETARGDIPLTLFEFNTLAALEIFRSAKLDVYLLEVGLGGRLDAVNILDADLAIITSIGIDHVDWLGNTRELIAREKAGIFRRGKPAVCGDFSPPQTLRDCAEECGTQLFTQAKEFSYRVDNTSWSWTSGKTHYKKLPLPRLALQNMSTVLMAVLLMQSRLPVARQAIDEAMASVTLQGRIQEFPGEVTTLFDVSHNPASAEWLANKLKSMTHKGKTRAVFSMLADKDVISTINVMKDYIDCWYIAELPTERKTPMAVLQQAFSQAEITEVMPHASIIEACQAAKNDAIKSDCIVVFGSFYVVAEAMPYLCSL